MALATSAGSGKKSGTHIETNLLYRVLCNIDFREHAETFSFKSFQGLIFHRFKVSTDQSSNTVVITRERFVFSCSCQLLL